MHINSFYEFFLTNNLNYFISMSNCDNSIVLALSGLIIVFMWFPLLPFLGYLLNNNNNNNDDSKKKSYEFLILFNDKYKEYLRKCRKFLNKIKSEIKFY